MSLKERIAMHRMMRKAKWSALSSILSPFDKFLLIASPLLTIIPLIACGFPWWADIVVLIYLHMFDFLGGVITLGIWVYSFIKVVSGIYPLACMIIYFIAFAVYFVFWILPTILQLFSRDRRDYYNY